MTDHPDLAALSAAATQGEWPYGGSCAVSKNNRMIFMAWPNPEEDDGSMYANADFITALVNAYREGRLVEAPQPPKGEQMTYACPMCGGSMQSYALLCEPPIYEAKCTSCGAVYQKRSSPEPEQGLPLGYKRVPLTPPRGPNQ